MHSALGVHDPRPKIIDTPLTLIFLRRQRYRRISYVLVAIAIRLDQKAQIIYDHVPVISELSMDYQQPCYGGATPIQWYFTKYSESAQP